MFKKIRAFIKLFKAFKRFIFFDEVLKADYIVCKEVMLFRHPRKDYKVMRIDITLLTEEEFDKKYRIDLGEKF